MLEYQFRSEIMDEPTIHRVLTRIAHQILEYHRGACDVALIGIYRRGVSIARILAEEIRNIEGINMPLGTLDITFYRDDLSLLNEQPIVHDTQIPFSVQGKKIIMVDDVIFSGRTARAGLDAICKRGRPAQIQLAVLVDRGHRELPIRADYVGKNLPTKKSERVSVHMPEFDGDMRVILYDKAA